MRWQRTWKADPIARALADRHYSRRTVGAELAKGHEVVPIGSACEGFSYTHGCPGHEVADTEVPR